MNYIVFCNNFSLRVVFFLYFYSICIYNDIKLYSYSLLGSSGCGKTTLLSCIVGIRNFNSGEILVFGRNPGSRGSGIPGKRVGYMPQDLALYNDFSINESMQYFAVLYNMSGKELKESREFLIQFLDLPEAENRIGSLRYFINIKIRTFL